MPSFRPVIRDFTGLNTKGLEDGRRATEFVNLQNARLREGAIKRRPGSVRLDVAGTDAKAMDFDGSTQEVTATVDPRVWALGTRFTIRLIFSPDATSTNDVIFRAGSATTATDLTFDNSNKLRWRVYDSDATLTTVTSTDNAPTSDATVLLTRDGATLSMSINAGTADTGTMDASKSLRTPAGNLNIAAAGGANWFDGVIDSLDVFNRLLPTNTDRWMRWPDPFADPTCLASYDFNATSDGIVKDRSRFRNNGYTTGSPTEVTALAHNPAPVWAIAGYRNVGGERRVYVEAGGIPYIVELD